MSVVTLPLKRLLVIQFACGALLSLLLFTTVASQFTDERQPSLQIQSITAQPRPSKEQPTRLKATLGSPGNVWDQWRDTKEVHLRVWNGNSSDLEGSCSDPAHPKPKYNSSCEYVIAECSRKVHLINYLEFVYCELAHIQVIYIQSHYLVNSSDLNSLQVLGIIMLSLWIVYLISLLATTASIILCSLVKQTTALPCFNNSEFSHKG